MSGDGVLRMVVWPTYVGVASAGVHDGNGLPAIVEPISDPVYERGQIVWTPVDDERQVIGRGRITCPPGEYTHFVYFQHPTDARLVGFTPMDHPVRFTEGVNVIDADPIINNDLQLSRRL